MIFFICFRVICLLCEENETKREKCTLKHIHRHLGYKKYACKGCGFSCYTDDEAVVHKYKLKHLILVNSTMLLLVEDSILIGRLLLFVYPYCS